MMNHQHNIAIAQKLLEGIGSGRSPTEIAALFDTEVVFEIQGDDGVLPWIGRKTGRRAIVNFIRDIRTLTESITFEVDDILAQTGSVVREGVVDPIAGYVRSSARSVVRIGLETGPTATWLWTELKQLGLPVICIDARHAKAVLKMQINKSDRNDAAGIARIMQTGWFKEVRVKDLRQPLGQGAAGKSGAAGQDQARSREPSPWPAQESRSRHRPRQVQHLRQTSRGFETQRERHPDAL
jgi:hypothetical protein